jgi:hypothetical protein
MMNVSANHAGTTSVSGVAVSGANADGETGGGRRPAISSSVRHNHGSGAGSFLSARTMV